MAKRVSKYQNVAVEARRRRLAAAELAQADVGGGVGAAFVVVDPPPHLDEAELEAGAPRVRPPVRHHDLEEEIALRLCVGERRRVGGPGASSYFG